MKYILAYRALCSISSSPDSKYPRGNKSIRGVASNHVQKVAYFLKVFRFVRLSSHTPAHAQVALLELEHALGSITKKCATTCLHVYRAFEKCNVKIAVVSAH